MSPLTVNAALRGGALGLAAGLVVLTWLLFSGESEQLPPLLLALPVLTFLGGLLAGYFLNKRAS